MSIPAATSILTINEDYARASLAGSAEFQKMLGVSTETSALSHIYVDQLPWPSRTDSEGNLKDGYTLAEMQALRPYGMVFTDEDEDAFTLVNVSQSDSHDYRSTGRIEMHIADNLPEETADNAEHFMRNWKNRIGLIMEEMFNRSGTAGYLDFQRLRLSGIFTNPLEDQANQGACILASLILEYGVNR